MSAKGQAPFPFQEEAWENIRAGKSGLVNAPTGCGKTFSVFLGSVIRFIDEHPVDYRSIKGSGLRLLWVTPLRALAKDIGRAMEEVITELGMTWRIGIRNGDTDTKERQQQKRNMPEVLIITPESLHLLLATRGHSESFSRLEIVAVDEWHELLGSKRGVQVELAISRLVGLRGKDLSVWGISATIGNLEEAKDVLLRPVLTLLEQQKDSVAIVKANIHKNIRIDSIFPDEIEKYPWAGHLGLKLAHKLVPILEGSHTTLIFINTRGMSETWYQALLNMAPELSGTLALHHGSIEPQLRIWVEEALHEGKLKAVVCTASLDLGVDFRPVETVVQVGSPKGVARFLQRAGRSGHQPDAVSHIWFLPTHSLELMEAAALKAAVKEQLIESREPRMLCFDVLVQYLCTLAVGEGFLDKQIEAEVRSTFCFQDMTNEDWRAVMGFITEGGKALQQ